MDEAGAAAAVGSVQLVRAKGKVSSVGMAFQNSKCHGLGMESISARPLNFNKHRIYYLASVEHRNWQNPRFDNVS